MGLYARVTSIGEDKLGVHGFSAALREWSRGSVTRQQVIDAFTLTAEDQVQLDAIATRYQSLNVTNKAAYLVKIHDVFLLVEEGLYDEVKARAELGF